MASEDEGKTEEPTGKRLSDAKEKGSIPRVQDLTQAITLLAGCLALKFSGGALVHSLEALLRECFRAIATFRVQDDTLAAWGVPALWFVAKLILPVAVPVVVAALAISILNAGLNFNPTVLVPSVDKAFQFSLAKLVNGKMWVEILKGVLRMGVVGLVGYMVVRSHQDEFLAMAAMAFPLQAQLLWTIALEAMLKMSLILVVLGIADWFWQKRTWRDDLKMTKQEVKDEARQSEGDPLVKGKIRGLRREMHRRFMLREVPKATVVVTNPTHFAVALRYRPGIDRAPVVVAKGADLLAKRIRELASGAGVPLMENPPLARALFAQAEPGDEIPSELYAAVAEILAVVLRNPRAAATSTPVAAWGLLLVLFLLQSCWPLGDVSEDPTVEISGPDPSGEYRGGDVVVRARLRRMGTDTSRFTWGLGRSTLISRGAIRDEDGNVVEDTLVVRWDTLPGARDTSGKTIPHDTLRFYVDNRETATWVAAVRNVLPLVDSLLVGPSLDSNSTRVTLPRGDTFVVAVHPGENALLRWRTHDPDKNWPIRWEIPSGDLGRFGNFGWRSGSPGDSVFLWKAPSDTLADTTLALRLTDGMGGGRSVRHLRLCTYREKGSIWTSTRTELSKVALLRGNVAAVVQRLRGFREIVALDIDPVREGGTLEVVDRLAQTVLRFTSTGILRSSTSVVGNPRAVACDVDGTFCWTGTSDSLGQSGILKRIEGGTGTFAGLPGTVSSVAVDQGSWRRAWFSSADSGFLGRTTGGILDTLVKGLLRRPVSMAWDETTSRLWVCDLAASELVAFDSSAQVVQRISGLSRPVSVSAFGGKVWVADLGTASAAASGQVLRIDSHSGSVETRLTGLGAPRAVVVDSEDPSRAWVAETENGRLLLVSGATVLLSTSGIGLDRPDLLAIHRGAP